MMNKILSVDQIKAADSATIAREAIQSIDLMERAAQQCATWLIANYAKTRPVIVFAGMGNNGGDALAVARKLLQEQFHVDIFLVRFSENFSSNCHINLQRLHELGYAVNYIFDETQMPAISSDALVIDGIFGAGLNKPITGVAAMCTEQINASIAEVIAIDIPSGLHADKPNVNISPTINAVYTLTFQMPKLSFLLPESTAFVGKWIALPIGLDGQYLQQVKSDNFLLESVADLSHLMHRNKFDHKGKFGHALMIAGSHGMMGACVLASRACMRTGVGKLTAHIPKCGYNIVQATIPEVMVEVDDYIEVIGDTIDVSGYQAIGVGPGLGTSKKTRRAIKHIFQAAKSALVLDADALNCLALDAELMQWIPKLSILTPHVGEFDRLVGNSQHSFDRLKKLRQFAAKHQLYVLLKGANTALAAPDGTIVFNNTGNPGMATAGSGDVLTGIITALLAQGLSPKDAALIGMHLHGKAGDLAAQKNGQHALIASDIIENIGQAMLNSFSFEA